jgi:hypothetical protein
LCVGAVVIAGCGVSFSAEDEQSEIFADVLVEGDFSPGGQLTLTLRYQQPYPAQIDVACDLLEDRSGRRADRLVARVLEQQILPTQGLPVGEGTPQPLEEITPVPGSFEQPFNAPVEPGRYEVECLTPVDDNNKLSRSFTIAPIPTVTPLDTATPPETE